jgi:FkbM family methyltransferase
MELRLEFESALSRAVVQNLPRFRGSTLAGSMLFRLMPCSSIVKLVIEQREFELDVKYRSHMAYVRTGPTWIEPYVVASVVETLRQGDVFFDVGSNWGFYTALGSVLVGDSGIVIAVEANAKPYCRLHHLLQSAKVTNALAFNYAASDRSGDLVKLGNPWFRMDTGGYVNGTHTGSDGRGVATKTLDRLWTQLGRPRVRMVKIDAEGFEPKIIRGGAAFMSEGVTDAAVIKVSEWTLA